MWKESAEKKNPGRRKKVKTRAQERSYGEKKRLDYPFFFFL